MSRRVNSNTYRRVGQFNETQPMLGRGRRKSYTGNMLMNSIMVIGLVAAVVLGILGTIGFAQSTQNRADAECRAIEDGLFVPPSQDVFDQAFLLLSSEVGENLITERVVDVDVPIAARGAGVYGYNADTSLNLTGGELYPASFSGPMFRVHGVTASQEKDVKFTGVIATLPIISDAFTSRGFNIPGPDTSLFNADHFTYRTNILSSNILGRPNTLIDMAFQFDGGNHVPTHLDIAAYSYTDALSPFYPTLSRTAAPYEADLATNRNPRFAYPIRVPVTTDCAVYNQKRETNSPITYYNDVTRQFEVSVTHINFTTVDDPIVQSSTSATETFAMRFFFYGLTGRFQLVRRDSGNNLIASSPLDANGAIQVSDTVVLKSAVVIERDSLELVDTSITYNYFNDAGKYTGVVAGKAAGGSPDFDIFILDPGFLNAFATPNDPYVVVPDNLSFGDNPSSLFVEQLSGVGNYEIFDSSLWKIALRKVGVSFIDTPLRPEDFASFPTAEPPSDSEITSLVNAHEFIHSMQAANNGALYLMIDGEAQALGFETDTSVNLGVMASFRPADFVEFTYHYARGEWPLLMCETTMTNTINRGTYGQGMFWQWLTKRHDPNHQIMRRANELLGRNALTIANLPGTIDARDSFIFYEGQYRLYLKQAAQELYGLDLHTIAKEFAISMSLIRSNGAIPTMYRSFYPYWTAQSNYPDALTLSAFGGTAKYWWEEMDLNIIPSDAAGRRGGTSMFPQLNTTGSFDIELQDLAANIFVVDTAVVSSVTVTSTQGRIVAMVHQFVRGIPDDDGTFTPDGPHDLVVSTPQVFALGGYAPQAQGLVRLVVTNIEITDFGGSSNILVDGTDRITGRVTIVTA